MFGNFTSVILRYSLKFEICKIRVLEISLFSNRFFCCHFSDYIFIYFYLFIKEMETYDALKKADDVKTFPTIAMPAPTFKVHTGRAAYSKTKDLIDVSFL